MNWQGTMAAITTPFGADGGIDHSFVRKHIEWLVGHGITGIVPCGSLGEGATLEPAEKVALLETCVAAAGDVPVVPGIAAASTEGAVRLAREAQSVGCSGLMLLPPYVHKGPDEEFACHFEALLEATDLECMLYNNPPAYGFDARPEFIAQLAGAHGNLRAVKESSGDVRRLTAVRALLGDRLALFAGLDDMAVEAAAMGASGLDRWVGQRPTRGVSAPLRPGPGRAHGRGLRALPLVLTPPATRLRARVRAVDQARAGRSRHGQRDPARSAQTLVGGRAHGRPGDDPRTTQGSTLMTQAAPIAMELHGQNLLGLETSSSDEATFTATDPRTGAALEGAFHEATADEVERALTLAAAAHPAFEGAHQEQGRGQRAKLIEAIADGIEGLGATLLERASAETGLPLARLEGERGRTCAQLRLFARVAAEGDYLAVRIDLADPDRKPLPKPDLHSMARALGPVVVFGASNFPLAYSVAGGDTASALAAGCPVIVKAHPAHPGTSELVGRVIVEAVRALGLPPGVFSMVHGVGTRVGAQLVQHPATRAVGFTGSLAGGRALFDLAAARPSPIPVFAEMGSVNPMFFLPERLAQAGPELGAALAASVTLGVGQFCTNPGVIIAERGEALGPFIEALGAGLAAIPEGTMLHRGICSAFGERGNAVAAIGGVEILQGTPAENSSPSARTCSAGATLYSTPAEVFLANPTLREEIFGPATLLVQCSGPAQVLEVARAFEGQLTATIHAADSEDGAYAELLPILEQRAGRLLFGGFPTGVEVCAAMVHGGPYPATTDSRSTSVGPRAIERFVRPIAYQNFPQGLLPQELRSSK